MSNPEYNSIANCAQLRTFAMPYRIAKAIDWLKLYYASALRIEELGERVQMSPSTFHHHFRQLTAISPLQYQKWLRLNEAKRLMLNEHLDVECSV